MKYYIPGLGGRLQRARNATGLSQEKVAERIGVSWMTVHRWERSQRSISEEHLGLISELYERPVRWFLTLEDGDLDQDSGQSDSAPSIPNPAGSDAAERVYRKITQAPAAHRPMIEKVVEDMLDGLGRSERR